MFDPVAYINEPRWRQSKPGLSRIVALMERLGNPQDQLRFVHVAGTNGKGSVCAYLASTLQEAGYKTGLFTSPYIETFEERIRVDGQNIPLDDLRDVTLTVKEQAEATALALGGDAVTEHPTEFELMTAVALEYFARQHCDIVVLEVGLGGLLDSTNVIKHPEVSVICRIGLDHTDILGTTLSEIASEKAGIIKPGCPVVSWPQEPEAMDVIKATAARQHAPLTTMDLQALHIDDLRLAGEADPSKLGIGQTVLQRPFSYRGDAFSTRLLGKYQPSNAALAIQTVDVLRIEGWSISDEALRRGIADTSWPGRFQLVAEHPLTIVDGGHNPQGAQVLVESLVDLMTSITGRREVTFVMGVLSDKDYPAMIQAVLPWASRFVVYTVPNPRALPASDLAAAIRELWVASPGDASDHDGGCSNGVGRASCKGNNDGASQDGRDGDTHSDRDKDFDGDGVPGSFIPIVVQDSPEQALAFARSTAGDQGIVVAFGSLYAIAALKDGLKSA